MSLTKIDFDALTGRNNPDLIAVGDFVLHPEMGKAFIDMKKAARAEAGVEIDLLSSYRDFHRQQMIWNDKVNGKRKILDDEGNQIDPQTLDEKELIEAIMRFSAIPGASRHHWGTDVDVYDSKMLTKSKIQLTVKESLETFATMNKWLDENMGSFGFFRPYDQDRGGVSEEPWHLSYAPIADHYFQDYNIDVFAQNIEQSSIALKEFIQKDLEFYFERYIQNINLP